MKYKATSGESKTRDKVELKMLKSKKVGLKMHKTCEVIIRYGDNFLTGNFVECRVDVHKFLSGQKNLLAILFNNFVISLIALPAVLFDTLRVSPIVM